MPDRRLLRLVGQGHHFRAMVLRGDNLSITALAAEAGGQPVLLNSDAEAQLPLTQGGQGDPRRAATRNAQRRIAAPRRQQPPQRLDSPGRALRSSLSRALSYSRTSPARLLRKTASDVIAKTNRTTKSGLGDFGLFQNPLVGPVCSDYRSDAPDSCDNPHKSGLFGAIPKAKSTIYQRRLGVAEREGFER